MKKRLLALIGIVFFVVILIKFDIQKIFGILAGINKPMFAVALALTFPIFLIKTIRWLYLLKMQGISYGIKDGFLAYMSAFYLGFITPGKVGDLSKTLHLKHDKGISTGKAFSSVLVDRLLDLVLLATLAVIGIFVLSLPKEIALLFGSIAVIIISVLVIILERRMSRRIGMVFYRFIPKKLKERVKLNYGEFNIGIKKLLKIRMIYPLILTKAAYALFFVQCFLAARALGIEISFLYIALFVATSNLVTLIPISVMGLGTREITLIFLFSIIGLSEQMAIAFSLTMLAMFIFSGIVGLVAWTIKPVRISSS